jgi:hypothetical protein
MIQTPFFVKSAIQRYSLAPAISAALLSEAGPRNRAALSSKTLLHQLFKLYASSCEPRLHGSLGHSQNLCCFPNAQAIHLAQLKGCT